MNVLILHSELGVLRGGGANFTRSLFPAFATKGDHMAAAFVAGISKSYPIPIPSGIRPIPIAGWWSPDFGQATFSAMGRCFASGSRLRKNWDRLQQGISWRTFDLHSRRFQRR